MIWTRAATVVAVGTCVFLLPFCVAAYVVPISTFNLGSVGLEPVATDPLTGLSNLRGSIGGLRLGIIAMTALGVSQQRRDLCLAAGILVASVSAGRFLSLVVDGWNGLSFFTASAEVVITAALVHLGRQQVAA